MRIKPFFLIQSLLLGLCLITFGGGLVYRFYALNRLGVAISLILAFIFFIIIQYYYFIFNKNASCREKEKSEKFIFTMANLALYFFYLLLVFFCFYILFKHNTTGAITSPWQVAPKYFFIIYFAASLILFANLSISRRLALPLLIIHYFLVLSVALIVYRLGYGYDPFIHQATEDLISRAGAVEPKPWYYLGQYALVVIGHKIAGFNLVWLDKILVPALAALTLPLVLFKTLKRWFNSERLNLIVILALLVLPLNFLIVTTPQNLGYLFLLLAILLGLICRNYYDYWLIVLLALSALITQPVAGIPAIILVGFLAVYHSNLKNKKYLYALLSFLAMGLLPALFFFLNNNLPAAGAAALSPLEKFAAFSSAGQNGLILNFVYFYGFNLKWVIGLLVFSGIFTAYKHRHECKIYFLYLGIASALFISYFLTTRLPFGFLIAYEQNNYAERILLVAAFFLLPFILISLYALVEKISRQNNFLKISALIFLICLLSASLYLAYPRYDAYYNSRGLSVSQADLEAVGWINDDASGDYLVLANQQVSAAALKLFGFKKYFTASSSQIFYYPIPTSSPLYQYYLDMVYKKASRETMVAAMELAGVSQSYFVLNKYWKDFAKILDQAKFTADAWQSFGDGSVYVFRYLKK